MTEQMMHVNEPSNANTLIPEQTDIQSSASSSQIHWMKWILLFVVFALLFSGVACVAYYVGMRNNGKYLTQPQPTSMIEESMIPTNSPVATLTSITDTTATWKEYTESSRGITFTLKYPPAWTVDTKDGMYGEKRAYFNGIKDGVGSVAITWNAEPVEQNCNTGMETKEMVQIKGKMVEMCHLPGSEQEPESYIYNAYSGNIRYSVVTSNFPGVENAKIILKVLSSLDI